MRSDVLAPKMDNNSQELNKNFNKTCKTSSFQDITMCIIFDLCSLHLPFRWISFVFAFAKEVRFFQKFLFLDIQTSSHLSLWESREMLLVVGTGSQAQLGPATPDFCLVSVFFLVFVFVFVGIRPQLHSWARPHLIFAF